jgi:hypothetical protein
VGVGVLVEAIGQKDPCAEKDVAAPEVAELFALEAHELEPLGAGVFGGHDQWVLVGAFDGGNDLVECELDGLRAVGVEVELDWLVVEVAGLSVPVLAFAFIRRQPDGFAGGEVERLIDIEDGLDGVVAGVEVL